MDLGEVFIQTAVTFQLLFPVDVDLEAGICLMSWAFSSVFGKPWHFSDNATAFPNGPGCYLLVC